MIESEEQLRRLADQSEQRQRKLRRNALWFTLLPILVAIGLLSFTGWQVQKSSENLAVSQAKLAFTQKTQTIAEASLSEVQTKLGAANQENTAAQAKLTENSRALADTLKQATQAQSTLTSALVQVAEKQKELDAKQTEVDNLKKQAEDLNAWLKTAPILVNMIDESKYYKGDILVLLKHIWNLQYEGRVRTGVAEVLEKIVANRQVSWKINGTSFEDGTNSPTFAALILNLLPQPLSASIDQPALMKLIPFKKDHPEIGDIVYYSEGYSFFYYEDEQGQNLVIGMSPIGIVALHYDFNTPIGIGKPNYKNLTP